MELNLFEVGKKYDVALWHPDEPMFDITDGGIVIPIFFKDSTEHEIEQFKAYKSVKMGFITRSNVIIMLMKFGDMKWMDAPYTPHLSINLTHFEQIHYGEGLSVHLMLFDTRNGELKTQRLFSLGEKMSKDLIKEIDILHDKPFDYDAYKEDIRRAYAYTTNELVKQAKQIYRIV